VLVLTLDEFLANAKKSVLFTSPVMEKDLSDFLSEQTARIKALAEQALSSGIKQIYWVGSGNSWCNLYSGDYIMNRLTDIPSTYYRSYDFIWANPSRLDKDTLVILASFSGNTEDTVAALRFANAKGATTVSFTSKADSILAREADEPIVYNSNALFILPLAGAFIFSLEVARIQGRDVEGLYEQLERIPKVLGKIYAEEESRALRLAGKYRDCDLFYVLASGASYALGYKFGLTVFMENMRINASFMETSEFRHGPAEMLDDFKPVMVFLVGTDESREMSERVIRIAESNGAEVIRFDARDYGDFDPLFSPFLLMVPLQWFAVYSAYYRGIFDLDERVLMGRGKMSSGSQITWP
jgi:fructoselysine-6-P-deglycase FrlB-like protein